MPEDLVFTTEHFNSLNAEETTLPQIMRVLSRYEVPKGYNSCIVIRKRLGVLLDKVSKMPPSQDRNEAVKRINFLLKAAE